MAGPLQKHAPPPQAKPEKTPHPPWSKPLTWLTALLAAGCLVLLLACLLQARSGSSGSRTMRPQWTA